MFVEMIAWVLPLRSGMFNVLRVLAQLVNFSVAEALQELLHEVGRWSGTTGSGACYLNGVLNVWLLWRRGISGAASGEICWATSDALWTANLVCGSVGLCWLWCEALEWLYVRPTCVVGPVCHRKVGISGPPSG